MNKKINYLIEYLAKSENVLYKDILEQLDKNSIYTKTKYEPKTIKVLASKSGIVIDDAQKLLDDTLQEEVHENLIEAKKQLFETLIKANFKKEKEQFDKVETSIFKCLSSYIIGITKAFDIFYVYTKNNQQEPEVFIEFANALHVKLVHSIFNEEEIKLLKDKLKEVMGVYLSIYARYLYE
jgi:flagellin-specific chaperone FliS